PTTGALPFLALYDFVRIEAAPKTERQPFAAASRAISPSSPNAQLSKWPYLAELGPYASAGRHQALVLPEIAEPLRGQFRMPQHVRMDAERDPCVTVNAQIS